MKYKIVLFDLKSNLETKDLKCCRTKAEAERAVREYRKKGLPAFYKKGLRAQGYTVPSLIES